MLSVGVCKGDVSDFEWRDDNTVQFVISEYDPPRRSALLQASGVSVAPVKGYNSS